jgi:hypothetical protein
VLFFVTLRLYLGATNKQSMTIYRHYLLFAFVSNCAAATIAENTADIRRSAELLVKQISESFGTSKAPDASLPNASQAPDTSKSSNASQAPGVSKDQLDSLLQLSDVLALLHNATSEQLSKEKAERAQTIDPIAQQCPPPFPEAAAFVIKWIASPERDARDSAVLVTGEIIASTFDIWVRYNADYLIYHAHLLAQSLGAVSSLSAEQFAWVNKLYQALKSKYNGGALRSDDDIVQIIAIINNCVAPQGAQPAQNAAGQIAPSTPGAVAQTQAQSNAAGQTAPSTPGAVAQTQSSNAAGQTTPSTPGAVAQTQASNAAGQTALLAPAEIYYGLLYAANMLKCRDTSMREWGIYVLNNVWQAVCRFCCSAPLQPQQYQSQFAYQGQYQMPPQSPAAPPQAQPSPLPHQAQPSPLPPQAQPPATLSMRPQ